MGGIEGIVALFVGLTVVLLVPALVWSTVVTGLIQIVQELIQIIREKVGEKRSCRERPPLPTRLGW